MKFLFLLTMIILSGCAHKAYNSHEEAYLAIAEESIVKALAEQEKGNWKGARKWYANAVGAAQMGKADTKALAVLYYEYGRSLGVTCAYEEAEFFFKKAFNLDALNSGPKHMSSLELARLNYDSNNYQKAQTYYESLFPIYEMNNAETIDPTGVALVYEEYSITLTKNGNKTESMNYKQRADNLRDNNLDKPSSTERTPYGTQCST